MDAIRYRSRWVVPVSQPPIENGLITVERGRIVEVSKADIPSAQTIDLGDVAIIPGLINAHTHLELTACAGRVPYRGSFAQWIKDLVAVSPARQPISQRQAAIQQGLRMSEQAGTSAIGDIGYGEHALAAWQDFAGHMVGFLEILGINQQAHHSHPQSLARQLAICQSALSEAAKRTICGTGVSPAQHRRDAGATPEKVLRSNLESPPQSILLSPPSCSLRVGLSPHAPYSVARPILEDTIRTAARDGLPLCTHLAETQEEAQFLADGRGPLRDLLDEWHLWDGSFDPPRCTPVQYAHQLGLLDQPCLLVHVNYVSDADLDLLTDKPVHVAYCPRAHAFFQHTPHRFADMLDRNINVCLGTDSLASNTSLSILDELRYLRHIRPQEPSDRLLRMATLNGAQALKLDHLLGTLEPGKIADLVAVPLEHVQTTNPIEDILCGPASPRSIARRGVPSR